MNRPEESLDVHPTDAGWEVVVPLPGVAASDVSIKVGETDLNIETSTTGSSETSGFRYHLALPADVAIDGVRTSLVDGVLTVTLPRREPLPPAPPAPPDTLSVPPAVAPPSLPSQGAVPPDLPPTSPIV